ncbi:hypothetical protein I3842_15G142200 [Carya illinoinensis]|uniref:AAA+ ATPase domain-containing protein n=1 Tax=Carya illinoinensis TaxID=32201 RepID=A0A922D7I8_CARIL|nr:hypothetical protein I3842_15G142200 [Carya illinoinensis]
MIGIFGIGGIGKTTIAKEIYNLIAKKFEGHCFLADVRESSKQNQGRLGQLQEKIISNILGRSLRVDDDHQGVELIRNRLCCKKILLVLDDVDHLDQLEKLCGKCDWFGSGSRIIIITRDKSLLTKHGVSLNYPVKEMDHDEALQLFTQHAFKSDKPVDGFADLIEDALHYASGLPLALKVVGSNLNGEDRNYWKNELEKYKRIPEKDIQEKLKISYDGLDDFTKKIFLDIACFFKGDEREYVTKILDNCDFFAYPGIKKLKDKCLITIDQYDGSQYLRMHDLIQDMGREIVRQESPGEPSKRSRLYFHKDVCEVLKENKGTKKVEGILIDLPREDRKTQLSTEAFAKLKNLRIFINRNASFCGGLEYLSNKLTVLDWPLCPLELLPSNFHGEKLIVLKMKESMITEFGRRSLYKVSIFNFDISFYFTFKVCCKFPVTINRFPLCYFFKQNLTSIDFSGSEYLTKISDLSSCSNLKELILNGCETLVKVHDSVGFLDRLVELRFYNCSNLKYLPRSFKLQSLELLELRGCTSLEYFPEIECEMKHLKCVRLDSTVIQELPSSITYLTGLKQFVLRWCKSLVCLPIDIFQLEPLEEVDVFCCPNFGKEVGQNGQSMAWTQALLPLPPPKSNFNLKKLSFSGSGIFSLPPWIEGLAGLSHLDLANCKQLQEILQLPPNIKVVDARRCTRLVEIHDSIGFLDKLVELRLEGCYSLKNLPRSFKLRSLKVLELEGCTSLEYFPEIECEMEHLKCVRLDSTVIQELPSSITFLTGLEKLYLRGCKSMELFPLLPPESNLSRAFNFSSSLSYLTLSNSGIVRLPPCIKGLVGLRNLDLEDCMQLEEILHLPPNIEYVNARRCVLLERFSNLSTKSSFGIPDLRRLSMIDLSECNKVHVDVGNDAPNPLLVQARFRKKDSSMIVYPGSMIPKWFKETTSYSNSCEIDILDHYASRCGHDQIMALVLSFVVRPFWERISITIKCGQQIIRNDTWLRPSMDPHDRACLQYIAGNSIDQMLSSSYREGNNMRFTFGSDSKEAIFKSAGVHLIYRNGMTSSNASPGALSSASSNSSSLPSASSNSSNYKVEPSTVRHQQNSFKDAFDKHEDRFKYDAKVQRWKTALKQAAGISGSHLTINENEPEFIQKIVQEVSSILPNRTCLHVAKYPIGLESRVEHIINTLLRIEIINETRMIGIFGIGGIGKTTITKAVYNRITYQFEGSCFLANVRENSKPDKGGLVKLQMKILSDILRDPKVEVYNVDRGINLIQEKLCRKKILLVLDDIDCLDQLEKLSGGSDWFGLGSRIIITTRDEHLLVQHDVAGIEELKDKCLITIEKYDRLMMHDLLEDMGKEIVRQESPEEPGKRSRLWFHDDVHEVLERNKGTEQIEGILIDMPWKDNRIRLGSDVFAKMEKLRILKVSYFVDVIFCGGLNYLSNELRVLNWPKCPLLSLPSSFHGEKLILLDISEGNIREFGTGLQSKNLTRIDLSGCIYLTNISDLSSCSNLEKLFLCGCTSLVEVHDSVGFLDKLVQLDFRDCFSLKKLPRSFKLISLKVLDLEGCTSLEYFPEIECEMEHLKDLWLEGKVIQELPSSITYLTGLETLYINISLVHLPVNIFEFEHLRDVSIINCPNFVNFGKEVGHNGQFVPCAQENEISSSMELLASPPPESNNLSRTYNFSSSLRTLNLSGSGIVSLPPCIEGCVGLSKLDLRECERLEEILYLPLNIEKVDASGCFSLESFLPKSNNSLSRLRKLNLSCSGIVSLPPCIEGFVGLSKLDLTYCKQLKEILHLPPNIEEVYAFGCSSLKKFLPESNNLSRTYNFSSSLRILELQLSGIVSLPPCIEGFVGLSKLKLTECKQLEQILDLPPNIKEVDANECSSLKNFLPESNNLSRTYNFSSSLRILTLHDSGIVSFPPCIKGFVGLSKLALTRCKQLEEILYLPPNIEEILTTGCKSLERFPHVSTESSFGTPDLKRLRMIDLSGCNKVKVDVGNHAPDPLLVQKRFREKESSTITYPGSRIPEWFKYCKMTSTSYTSSIEIVIDHNASMCFGHHIVALVLCFVMGPKGTRFGFTISMNGHQIKNDHLWLWDLVHDRVCLKYIAGNSIDEILQRSFREGNNNMRFTFESDGKKAIFKSAGVHLIYGNDNFIDPIQLSKR